MTTITKKTRAEQIAAVIETVSKYFEVDPRRVLTSFNRPGSEVVNARHLIWHHMHRCGMSHNSIGRIFKLSDTHVAKGARTGMIRADDEDRLLLATLPVIETTLNITHA